MAPPPPSNDGVGSSPSLSGGAKLQEDISGLDAELEEIQRLHEMTADADIHEGNSGGGDGSGSDGSGSGSDGSGSGSDGSGSGGGKRLSVDGGGGFGNGAGGSQAGAAQEAVDEEVDRRSVYVGNVDYSATPHELQDHFKSCGNINRITIMVDKLTGHPKGFAYVEFDDVEAVQHAVLLSDTVFRSRQIKVIPKRKNLPSFMRGRGRGRSTYRGRGRGGYRPFYRGRGSFGRGYGRPY
eukprot:GHVS01012095.1.p1 GENE.GHVS01012095.1~~GHVS01012095.1.p1  ORF type:complete len:238 (+),score=69.61 GHVS01012095.1:134-847(+)